MATFKLMPNKQEKKASLPIRKGLISPPIAVKLVSQEAFQEILRLERRRTERSGRPFLLVLISGEELQGNAKGEHWGNISKAIASCIRETDVFGWYEQHGTLGVMMTEIGESPMAAVETIVRKISIGLEKSVSAEIYCRIAMVVRVFPNEGEDKIFYPDVTLLKGKTKAGQGLKRCIDILGSLAALLVLSPLFVIIGILVKSTSKGPILFSKKRVGRHGKEFSFYKFRSMFADNDPHIHQEFVAKLIAGDTEPEHNDGFYKITNDPRVTPIGRFLRRTSLDELPQFFNVLFNDMSLVGPRPPLPYEYERYRPWHKRRVLELKPGITGLWQVEGRSRTTFDEMVRMDIRYARVRTIWLDIKIMIQTPAAMFLGRGAV